MKFPTLTSRFSRTCFALFAAAGVWAQPSPPAAPSQKGAAALTRGSFTAKGLQHEDDLTNLFVGNFGSLAFDRGSAIFGVLFEQYMEAYARHCDAYLPGNKVEMTRQVCDDPPPRPLLPGERPPLFPTRCSTWRTVSLGYADPVLYAAKAQFDDEQTVNQVNSVLGSLNNLKSMAVDGLNLIRDMDALVRLNACNGAGLRRFQENVVLFSKGKQPLPLPGAPPPAPLPPSRDPAIQAKARAEASVQSHVCVPDDLLAEWRNPVPGSKMEALKSQLKASLRERATLRGFDQTKWMTVNSRIYSTWNPSGPFRGVVTATDGGSCAVGQHEVLALTP
jgi:hypothetical protein